MLKVISPPFGSFGDFIKGEIILNKIYVPIDYWAICINDCKIYTTSIYKKEFIFPSLWVVGTLSELIDNIPGTQFLKIDQVSALMKQLYTLNSSEYKYSIASYNEKNQRCFIRKKLE